LLVTLVKNLPLLIFIAFAYYYFNPQTFGLDAAAKSLQLPVMEQIKNTMLITF